MKLQKDLLPNEEICQECKGLGLQIDDNPFALQGETYEFGFPYKKQTIKSCPHCFTGVRKRCEHCQELIPLSQLSCSCPAAEEIRRSIEETKEIERWEQAKKISSKEEISQYEMFFVEDWEECLTLDEIFDRLDAEPDIDPPKRVYATRVASLGFDAMTILENACNDLHEEVLDHIDDNQVSELQSMLDEWAKQVRDYTKTYYPDYNIAVVLD